MGHFRFFVLLLSIALLQGCFGTQNPAPVTFYGAGAGAGSAGTHVVQAGDTLYSISKRYKIVMRDIVIENRMHAPFLLQTGVRLKLPAPREHVVRSGDTLYGVARLYAVGLSEVARLNDLNSPYILHSGQILRLPSQSRKNSALASNSQKKLSEGRRAQEASAAVKRSRIAVRPPPRSSGKFLRPVDGKIISGFGPKKNGLHNDGINIAVPKGTPVRAAENGVVVYAGNELKGSGNLILIRHEGRLMSAYAHLDNVLIKRGQVIKRGQSIGTVGTTGSVSKPQLHFEVRKGTRAVNPVTFI